MRKAVPFALLYVKQNELSIASVLQQQGAFSLFRKEREKCYQKINIFLPAATLPNGIIWGIWAKG